MHLILNVYADVFIKNREECFKISSLNESGNADNVTWLQKNFLHCPYRVFTAMFCIYIAFGFIYARPEEIMRGLWTIIINPDILVTDYIATAGIGATYVNVALSGLLVILVLMLIKHEPTGLTIGTFGLVMGFAFFGKNPVNMAPIILGGFFYSLGTKEPINKCILPPILATCLGPTVTQLAFIEHLNTGLGITLGIIIGITIGLIINPIAKALRANYESYNLYNVGFAAGMVAIGIMVIFRITGIEFTTLSIWSEGYNTELMVLLLVISLYFIICGLLSSGKSKFLEIAHMQTDDLDFYMLFGGRSYINMGLMGLLCFLFMLAVRGDYNGPVIGAIMSAVGFGALGKRILSAIPLMAGAMLAALAASLTMGMPLNSRGFLVAAVFSTCLSPLCTKFGWKWGVIAGFIHLCFASNVTDFHGGMNLYNNGLAAGLTAMLLLPVIRVIPEFKRKKKD